VNVKRASITKKIRLNIVPRKPSANGVKKTSSEDISSVVEDDFWTDCIELKNSNQSLNQSLKTNGKKKSNSVCAENDLQMIKESEEIKEETTRNTRNKFEGGNLTFKKGFQNNSFQDTRTNNFNTSIGNNNESLNYRNSDTVPVNKEVVTRQDKFRDMLNRMVSPKDKKERNKSNGNNQPTKTVIKKDRCLMLYQKGKAKAENDKLKLQKTQEEKEEKILSQCTFKPQTISNIGKNEKPFDGKEFYEKTVGWKQKQQEKVEKVKTDKEKKQALYSFKPEIHGANKDILFNPKKNIDKSEKNTKKFMDRLENARTEEVKKKERYDNLGKVKASAASHMRNSSQEIITQGNNNIIETSTNNMMDKVVKNLRSQLQEIKLETTSEVNI